MPTTRIVLFYQKRKVRWRRQGFLAFPCLERVENRSVKKSLNSGTDKGDHSKTTVAAANKKKRSSVRFSTKTDSKRHSRYSQCHDLHNFRFHAVLLFFLGHVLHQTSIQAKVTGGSIAIVHVKGGQFNKGHKEEDLDIDSPANGSGGTKNVRVGVGITGDVDSQLLGNNTANGKHADTSVLDFGPTGVVQVGLDVGTVVLFGLHIVSNNEVRHLCHAKAMIGE